jgi:hypothetical protein
LATDSDGHVEGGGHVEGFFQSTALLTVLGPSERSVEVDVEDWTF